MSPRLLAAIPNALSLFRIVLGIAFPCLPSSWRVGAVLAAGFSDLADGASSRHFHASSVTGRILDPVADKVFGLGVVIALVADGSLEIWEVALLGLRDLLVLGGAGWCLVRRNWSAVRGMSPTLLGKATTAAQFLFVLLFLIRSEKSLVVFLLTAGLSGLGGAHYVWLFLKRDAPRRTGDANYPTGI
jgi:phosphatidylglycerophosphate synthase